MNTEEAHIVYGWEDVTIYAANAVFESHVLNFQRKLK